MTDNDQSSAAARRPHRPNGDNPSSTSSDRRPSAWERIKALVTSRSPSLRHDLQEALEDPEAEGETSFSASERAILQNVLYLSDMRVEDVMVPRADIEAVDSAINVGSVVARFREVGHSRLPVFEESLDNVLGMVHIKDVLDRLTEPTPTNGTTARATTNGNGNGNGNGYSPVKLVSPVLKQKLSKLGLVRKVLFVPPSMPVTDLLQSMQATRIHMAVVVDEYGGTDGLVTIEDLLEAVVGDIEDEHDESEAVMLKRVDDDVFVADARVELSELTETIGDDFDPGEFAEDVDTLGGLISGLAGRVPVRGELVSKMKGFEFEILRADPRRVRQVRITRRRRVPRTLRSRVEDPEDGSGPDGQPAPESTDADVRSAAAE